MLGPVGLVPSLPDNPLARRSAIGCLPDTVQKFFKAGKIIQFYPLTLKRPFIEVDVCIDKTRHHQATFEIDLFSVWSGQIQHILVSAHSQDLSVSNGNGLCMGMRGALGGKDTVVKNDLGHQGRQFHIKNPF